jgi:MFS family permease
LAEGVAQAQSPAVEEVPHYYRRNAWAFALDMGLFHIGISFISSTTVLPSLIAMLTSSEVIVGLASGITSGAWMLPQLFVASYVARLDRKKPLVVRTAWSTRPILLAIAVSTWLFGLRAPAIALAVTMLGMFAFFFLDAVVSLPWFDLMARGLPARRRGRIQGIAQVLGGVGGIGAGMLVRHILSDASPWAFPADYAILFALASLTLCGSSTALSCIYEPASPAPKEQPPSSRQVLASLPRLLADDRPFLALIAARIGANFVGVANAFYVLYATRNLGFAIADTGLFLSAQLVGQLASGLLMGVVQDRWGPRLHIRLNMALSLLPPLLALLSGGLMGSPALRYVYPLIYFFLGLHMGSIGWPYFNWIMEHAEEARRPLYIGTSNTLGAVLMVAPVLGGWIVTSVSYPAVFVAAALFALSGLLLSRWVPSTR